MPPALAAQRATDVLRYVARHADERLTLTELAARLDVSPAAMHAVITALVESGFLQRERDKTLKLGPESMVLGSAARAQDSGLEQAAAAARTIVDRFGLPATVLAQRSGTILVLDGMGGHEPRATLGAPGASIPFAAPFGAVFVADARPQEVVAWFDRAGVDPACELAERYRAELHRVAARGWSVAELAEGSDHDQEWTDIIAADAPGSRASTWGYLVDHFDTTRLVLPAAIIVALGIRDAAGSALALAVRGFTEPMLGPDLEALGHRLAETATAATATTG